MNILHTRNLLAVSLVSTLCFGSLSAHAEEATAAPAGQTQEIAPTAAAAPQFKATATTYYYDFQGTQSANNNLYAFKDVNLSMQLLIPV